MIEPLSAAHGASSPGIAVDLQHDVRLHYPCSTLDVAKTAAKRLDDQRRAWLNPPDATLDRAVWAAYGWKEPPEETDDETILSRLLALNLESASEY